ncbi:MAG: hydantoinase/oxoprolinase family protein [Pseudomonadota bacterium]
MIRLATDVGGTFTDLVALEPQSGRLITAKVLTTPADPSQGVMTAIAESGLEPSAIDLLVHGGTTVINALTERKGAVTALITTRGFRDVLEIGRGNRPDLYNLRFRSPPPFIPRALRFEIAERVSAAGEVLQPLDEAALPEILKACRAAGVEAIAVAFLNSYANPGPEARCAALVQETWPEVSVTASHSLTRARREFERSNTAALNAYVQPVMSRYLRHLGSALEGQGVAPPYLAMLSNGGTASFDWAAAQPLQMVESGPAAGLAGAAALGRAAGIENMIALDIGGTTAKCAMILEGAPRVEQRYALERSRLSPGYPLLLPVVDIVEIGAGGGSLARQAANGSLQVGPESAGADPGPACYGRGGEAPTVTDAALLCGLIDPERFAGGRLPLDPKAAAAAIAPLAAKLDLSTDETALAVLRMAEASMINALQLISVQRGHDPRDFPLLVSGGGGGLHGAALAKELGITEVIVPPRAGIFSAWGMLASAPRLDQDQALTARVSDLALKEAAGDFELLQRQAAQHFASLSSDRGSLIHQQALDLRYLGQEHSVTVPIGPADGTREIRQAFDAAHRKAYSFDLPEAEVEVVGLRLTSSLPWPALEPAPLDQESLPRHAKPRGTRRLLLEEGAVPDCPVYARSELPIDQAIVGPCLVEEETTTTAVRPGQTLRRDGQDLLWISLQAGA